LQRITPAVLIGKAQSPICQELLAQAQVRPAQSARRNACGPANAMLLEQTIASGHAYSAAVANCVEGVRAFG